MNSILSLWALIRILMLLLGDDKGSECQCGPCCQKRNKLEKRRTVDKLLKIIR